MLFKCRQCGTSFNDIDRVLSGSCVCGSTHFKLVSQERAPLPTSMTTKEEIRRDLHRWIDLNIDSMEPETLSNIRVVFEFVKE